MVVIIAWAVERGVITMEGGVAQLNFGEEEIC